MIGTIKTALLVALVAGQAATDNKTMTSTDLSRCMEKKGCDPSTRECQAFCVGVPAPSANSVDDTTSCVANCAKDDAEKYKTCSQNCINKYFRKIDMPQPNNKTSGDNKTDNATVPALPTSSVDAHGPAMAVGSVLIVMGTMAFSYL